MIFPLQRFLSHLCQSKRRHFAKGLKTFQDYSFQKKNAKGLRDLQNLFMVFSWNIIDFIEISFLFDLAISIGVLRCWFLMVSNALFCKRILAKSNYLSSLTQKWRRESLSRFKELTLASIEISNSKISCSPSNKAWCSGVPNSKLLNSKFVKVLIQFPFQPMFYE